MMGPGFRLDLHVHSRHSRDGRDTVPALAQAARRVGLHGFALTDHNTVAGHKEIAAAARQTGLVVVPGVEVSTAQGHLLAYGVQSAPEEGAAMAATVAEVARQGGVAVPSHPLRMATGVGPTDLRHLADAGIVRVVEARNGRDRPLLRANVERSAQELGLAGTGGSDAHHARDVGACWTEFPGPIDTVEDVLDALRRGACAPHGASIPRSHVWGHRLEMLLRR